MDLCLIKKTNLPIRAKIIPFQIQAIDPRALLEITNSYDSKKSTHIDHSCTGGDPDNLLILIDLTYTEMIVEGFF